MGVRGNRLPGVCDAQRTGSPLAADFQRKPACGPDVHSARSREATPLFAFFRAAFEQAKDAMLAVGRDGRVLETNAAACALFERPREQIIRGKMADLVRSAAEVELPAESGGFPSVAHREGRRDTDGRARDIEVTILNEVTPDVHLVIARDRREAQDSEAHWLRADRLATFGMLAVGVAHEINNPLMYAMANLRTVLERMPEWTARAREDASGDLADALEQSTRLLGTASEGMDRIATLVRDLRVSSHEGDAREAIDLRTILESCLHIAHGEIRQKARVVRDYAEDAIVIGNSGRLGQVFLNLLVNAAQAIPGGQPSGEIRVVIRDAGGEWLAVEISDNGSGISPQAIDRVFEPFYTTKAANDGTGLGLYIARSIINELGGRIDAESTPGTGTTLRVTLPKVSR